MNVMGWTTVARAIAIGGVWVVAVAVAVHFGMTSGTMLEK